MAACGTHHDLPERVPAGPTAFAHCCPVDDAALSAYAGSPVRVFDPFDTGVARDFADFLDTVPMQNLRPLPARAVRETRSALSMFQGGAGQREPTYFVATNVDRTTIAPQSARRRAALAARYGEALYPQAVSPVFASHADADVPSMLSAATGLDADYFVRSPGSRDRLHALFLLTEASHCGFLARYRGHEALLASLTSVDELRALIEAIGDFEAIAAFRALHPAGERHDEADVLAAARVLAMFLAGRSSAYTTIPALAIAFSDSGIVDGARRLAELTREVESVRRSFRDMSRNMPCALTPEESLYDLRDGVRSMLADDAPGASARSSIQSTLLRRFCDAVLVILDAGGTRELQARDGLPGARLLETLPGITPAPRSARYH